MPNQAEQTKPKPSKCYYSIALSDEDAIDAIDIMLPAIRSRCQQRDVTMCEIFPSARDSMGFLHWITKWTYANGSSIIVGAIQRKVDAEIEFHS